MISLSLFARALSAQFVSLSQFAKVLEQLQALAAVLHSQTRLRQLLRRPRCDRRLIVGLLEIIGQTLSLPESVMRAMSWLLHTRRIDLLPDLIAQLTTHYQQQAGIVPLSVWWSHLPAPEIQQALEAKLQRLFPAQTLQIETRSDATLLSGCLIQTPTALIDLSGRRTLRHFRHLSTHTAFSS